jgi:hypothetical protein
MLNWQKRLQAIPLAGKIAEYTYWFLRLPVVPKQVQRLCETNATCFGMIADLLPRLQQDVNRTRAETIKLAQEALPDMRAASRESKEEVQRLKHRYAEFYGAIVEQLLEQNKRLEQLAQQQAHIIYLIGAQSRPASVPLTPSTTTHWPKAG